MPAAILFVSSDVALLDDLLRLAAAADVPAIAESAPSRSDWHDAGLVVVGAEAAAGLAGWSRRAGVVLVSGSPCGEDVYRLAVDIGAQDVAVLPEAQAWLIDRMAAAAEPAAGRGAVIGVLGGRGGAGASVLSVVLARSAATRGLRTLLVDGDPLGGGIDLVLGTEASPGARWNDFCDRRGRLSGTALHDSLPAASGLAVLSWHRGAVEPLAGETMRSVLDAASRGYELAVVDLPRHLSEAAAEALSCADTTLLVVPAEVRATVAADRVAETVRPHTKDLRVVVRGPAPGGLKPSVIAESLRLPLAGTISTDRRLAAALERGDPPPAGRLNTFCARFLDSLARAGLCPDVDRGQ